MSATAMLWIAGALIACAAIALVAWALFADRARGRRRCPRCWYDMSGAASAASVDGDGSVGPLRCPECGREIKHARQLARIRRRWRWTFASALLLLAAGGCFITGKAKRDGWESVTPTTVLILIAQWSDDPWALKTLWDRSTGQFHAQGFIMDGLQEDALWDWQWRRFAHVCLDLLDSKRSETVRELAMDSLQRVDLSFDADIHRRALELWPSLVNDPNPVIQSKAVLTSGGLLPIEQAIAVVAEHVHSTDLEVQSAAISALHFVDRRGGQVRDFLFDLLETGSVEQRRGAAATLRHLRSVDPNAQRTIGVLLSHFRSDPDAIVRCICLGSLARSEAPRDLMESLLAQAVADKNPKIRECAIGVETSIANMTLLVPEHLFQCLNDQDQKVRDAAAWGLTYIDSERLRDHVLDLQRLLDHADEGIAQAAARKLDELGIEPAAGKPAR